MNSIEHFHKEIDVFCIKLRPATKAMQFGGDRTMKAQWIVHMPVRAQGRLGRTEAFVVWPIDPQGHEDSVELPRGQHESRWLFFHAVTQQASTTATETYTLEHYLELTGRPPPNLEEEQENETSHPEDDDDDTNTCYRDAPQPTNWSEASESLRHWTSFGITRQTQNAVLGDLC